MSTQNFPYSGTYTLKVGNNTVGTFTINGQITFNNQNINYTWDGTNLSFTINNRSYNSGQVISTNPVTIQGTTNDSGLTPGGGEDAWTATAGAGEDTV